jgi:carboxypeptidase Q
MNKTLLGSLAIVATLFTPTVLADAADLEAIHRIKNEAFEQSQVMDYMHILADQHGSRLSGSREYRQAAELSVAAFKDAGIKQAGLESWGVFGRGWSWSRIAVQMQSPQQTTLSAVPADWSGATDGPVSGEVVFAPLWPKDERPEVKDLVKRAEQIERYKNKYRGKLDGKIVMFNHPEPFALPDPKTVFRFSDEDLGKLSKASEPGLKKPLEWPLLKNPLDPAEKERLWNELPVEVMADQWLLDLELSNRLAAFHRDEGVKAILLNGWAQGAGVIMHSDYGSFQQGDPIPPASVVMMSEQYNRIHRLLEREVPVVLEVDVEAEFLEGPQDGLNVIAELPGSERRGELVMLGAHLDSWHGSTGATDNAAGVAVVMEAMRILKALDLPLKRTVRAALWGGEEQGFFGSRGYVKNHFGDPITMALKAEHKKLSVYFNLDNGGGKIRGIYLQNNDMARPIFETWLAPFADLGVSTATIINTDGTDHLSFNAVGLPGFNFVQDPLDYSLNTHHSNVDDVSHIVPGDLMQAAAVMAASVYHAANRDEMMPRKPLPAPLPPKNPLPEILRKQ